jgi:hypothetical protein
MILTILFFILIGAALIINLVASIWFLVAAFRESILWGLAILFLPVAGIVFLIMHWDEVRTPFLLNLLAIMLFVISFFVLPRDAMPDLAAAVDQPISSENLAQEEASFSFTKIREGMQQAAEKKKMRQLTANRGYRGRTLVSVEEELGPPKGIITTSSGETHYYYTSLELISSDGLTVADEIHK